MCGNHAGESYGGILRRCLDGSLEGAIWRNYVGPSFLWDRFCLCFLLGPIGDSFGVRIWTNPMGKILWTNPLDESNSLKNTLRGPLAQILWRSPLKESAQCSAYEKLYTDLIWILYMSEWHPTEILQTQYIAYVQTHKSYVSHTDICIKASRHHIHIFLQECYRHPTAILWESFRMPKARLHLYFKDISHHPREIFSISVQIFKALRQSCVRSTSTLEK